MKNSFKLFILAHKNNRGIHKKVVYTVIMVLLFLLLIIPFSIFKTYDNELKRLEKEDDMLKIIIYSPKDENEYKLIEEKDANSHKPTVVFLDSDNNPCEEKECKRTVGK